MRGFNFLPGTKKFILNSSYWIEFSFIFPLLAKEGVRGRLFIEYQAFLNSVKIMLAASSIFFSIVSFCILNIRIPKLFINSSRILFYSFVIFF